MTGSCDSLCVRIATLTGISGIAVNCTRRLSNLGGVAVYVRCLCLVYKGYLAYLSSTRTVVYKNEVLCRVPSDSNGESRLIYCVLVCGTDSTLKVSKLSCVRSINGYSLNLKAALAGNSKSVELLKLHVRLCSSVKSKCGSTLCNNNVKLAVSPSPEGLVFINYAVGNSGIRADNDIRNGEVHVPSATVTSIVCVLVTVTKSCFAKSKASARTGLCTSRIRECVLVVKNGNNRVSAVKLRLLRARGCSVGVTVNLNVVAYNELVGPSRVRCALCILRKVYKDLVAVFVTDVELTVLCINNFYNSTLYVELLAGSKSCKIFSGRDRDYAVAFGRHSTCTTLTVTMSINVLIDMTESRNLICSVAVATLTSVSGVTCNSTSRSSNYCLVAMLVCGGDVVRIFLAALALTVYEVVLVRGNVVGIFCTALALTVNEVVLVRRINGLLTLSSVELRDEAVVRNCARSYGCVGLVVSGTEPVVNAVNVSDESLAGCIICINSGSCCFISAVYVGSAYNHVDVSLGSTDEAVEIITALGLLKIYVDSCSSIGYSVHVVTVHLAVEVINLTVVKVALNHTELIAGTNNRVNNYEVAAYYRGNVVRILLATRANAINEVVLVYGGLNGTATFTDYINNGVDNCSGLAACALRRDGNGLVYRSIDGDSVVCTVVRVAFKRISGSVDNKGVVVSVVLISCCVNDYGINVCRNCEGKRTCKRGSTELEDGVTLCIETACINLGKACENKLITAGGVGGVCGELLTIVVSSTAVSAEIEYDLTGYGRIYGRSLTAAGIVVRIFSATLALTVNIVVLVGRLNRTAGSEADEPSVLSLCGAAVAANGSKDGDSVAYTGLGCHCIVSNLTVLAVETVDVEGVALCILNVKVAVSLVLYLGDLTGDNVLVFGIGTAE